MDMTALSVVGGVIVLILAGVIFVILLSVPDNESTRNAYPLCGIACAGCYALYSGFFKAFGFTACLDGCRSFAVRDSGLSTRK